MPEYEISVERDGRYLLIHIPTLGGVTQARFRGEVERMAGDYIAVVTDTPVDDIGIRLMGPVPALSAADYEATLAELADEIDEIDELRDRLTIYEPRPNGDA